MSIDYNYLREQRAALRAEMILLMKNKSKDIDRLEVLKDIDGLLQYISEYGVNGGYSPEHKSDPVHIANRADVDYDFKPVVDYLNKLNNLVVDN